MTEQPVSGRFEWTAARSTIPMAVGLSVAAFRVSVLPRTWALLMSALILDDAVSMVVGMDRQKVARAWAFSASKALPESIRDLFDKALVGPLGLASPFLDLLSAKSVHEAILALAAIGLTLVIWGLFGGAICRIAVARMTGLPMPGYFGSLKYAARHGNVIWGPPVVIAGLVSILVVVLAILGSVSSLPVVGRWIAWIAVPAMIFPAAVLVLAVAGVMLGWPMMLGAAMFEESDVFDTLSRSQSYLFQAPVTWALTIKMGLLIQAAGYYLVRWFLRALVATLRSAAGSVGAAPDAIRATDWSFPDPWSMPMNTSDAFEFWSSAIKLAAVTWPIGFVFAFSAALYLALKSRVDLVPPQDVSIE